MNLTDRGRLDIELFLCGCWSLTCSSLHNTGPPLPGTVNETCQGNGRSTTAPCGGTRSPRVCTPYAYIGSRRPRTHGHSPPTGTTVHVGGLLSPLGTWVSTPLVPLLVWLPPLLPRLGRWYWGQGGGGGFRLGYEGTLVLVCPPDSGDAILTPSHGNPISATPACAIHIRPCPPHHHVAVVPHTVESGGHGLPRQRPDGNLAAKMGGQPRGPPPRTQGHPHPPHSPTPEGSGTRATRHTHIGDLDLPHPYKRTGSGGHQKHPLCPADPHPHPTPQRPARIHPTNTARFPATWDGQPAHPHPTSPGDIFASIGEARHQRGLTPSRPPRGRPNTTSWRPRPCPTPHPPPTPDHTSTTRSSLTL